MQAIIYQTNAFTDVPFGGKSVAIVPDASGLSEQDVLDIIRVLKLEKTVFVYKLDEDMFKLRFFNEMNERKFCGSSIISAFYTLAEKGYIDKIEDGVVRVFAETKIEATPIDIYIEDWNVKRVEMTKSSPTLLQKIDDYEIIADMLGLDVSRIGVSGHDISPELVYSGTQDLIIPLKDEADLFNTEIDFVKAKEAMRTLNMNLSEFPKINLFYLSDDMTVESRQFRIKEYRIVEKACSGTENASMVFFLKRNKLISDYKFICFKGCFEVRPSTVYCEIMDPNVDCPIKIGGMGNIFYEGILSL